MIIPTPSPSDSARDLKNKKTGETRATVASLLRANREKGIQLKRKRAKEKPETKNRAGYKGPAHPRTVPRARSIWSFKDCGV